MISYYMTLSELDRLGFNVPSRRQLEVVGRFEDACELCGAKRAPRFYHDPEKLATWVLDESHRVGNLDRFSSSTVNAAISVGASRVLADLPEDLDRCVCCDSQLSATVGIPRHVFLRMWDDLDAAQRRFLEGSFTIMICGGCRSSEAALLETAASIERTFVRVRCDGIMRELASYPEIERFREILLMIDAVLGRLAG